MKLSEISDEELTHLIWQAARSDQLYVFPERCPSTQRLSATTSVASTRYTFMQLSREAARRLAVKSDCITRPSIEVNAKAVWVNDGFFMGFGDTATAMQMRRRLVHLLGMEGAGDRTEILEQEEQS